MMIMIVIINEEEIFLEDFSFLGGDLLQPKFNFRLDKEE